MLPWNPTPSLKSLFISWQFWHWSVSDIELRRNCLHILLLTAASFMWSFLLMFLHRGGNTYRYLVLEDITGFLKHVYYHWSSTWFLDTREYFSVRITRKGLLYPVQLSSPGSNAAHIYIIVSLSSFYRYVLEPEVMFQSDGSYSPGPLAKFLDMPQSPLFTLNLNTPESWMVESVHTRYDLDNIYLEEVRNSSSDIWHVYTGLRPG